MENKKKTIFSYLIPILILTLIFQYFGNSFNKGKRIDVTELVTKIEENKVKEIKTIGGTVEGTLKDDSKFFAELPKEFQESFYKDYLKDRVENKEIKYDGEREAKEPIYLQLLTPLIMLVGFALLWYMLMQKTQGGNSQAMNFGKSRAQLHEMKGKKVTFDEVAGLKEEKEELLEVVEFLKQPKKYIDQGARIPKGILLVGPPGTGKTYISKAVAGEAGVPFYSISGSDFVEMFVGVGASRVRDMFKEAKKNSPCIIFIDEIDAVGRRRGAGLGGGHDEREQTLNQLLVEMDGFDSNEGIIMMAATNRPDILDPALLRPGRFDRRVQIGMPDVRERLEILKVHIKNKRLSDRVDLENIAKSTVGFSPADLENLTNEAALLTARHNQSEITPEILEEATIKVIAGPAKRSRVIIEKERKLTAYHEAGHAVVTHFLPETDPVHMITIIPRGSAGGFTAFIPEEDTSYMTKKQMTHEIVSLLGGRAAEAIVLDDISTGASNDIERASKIARAMVTVYGMSDKLGPIQYGSDDTDVFLGRDYGKTNNYSDKVALEIDEEVRNIIGQAYEDAKDLLNSNRDFLEELSLELLEKETLRREDFLVIAQKYDDTITDEDIEKAKGELL